MTTIEDVERSDWGDPEDGETPLVRRCRTLRRTPIDELEVDDLRVLVAQEIGLDVVVPLALEVVERNPLASGDFYAGDLLIHLAKIAEPYWADHTDWWLRLRQVVESYLRIADELQRFSDTSRGGA